MRELTSHKVNGLNESLHIQVIDDPGAGNACHHYVIGYDKVMPRIEGDPALTRVEHQVCFQNGPISESGVNGISGEALLAIVEDRLIGFQAGKYACRENRLALERLQEAMMWLHKRTLDRVKRGVEGTIAK